ncbi:c-type cytochrome [Aggregatilinea lenta]|uniref:c-type cytochrome n=1 Tax=Aggregatilinea lenta TaxID=913108 RepID=UPI000E5C392F|nr:cytochrome c [Aggregatilinea lenta]
MENVSRHSRKWILLTVFMCGFVLLQTVWLVQAASNNQSAEEGRAIFEQYCASCHTVGGGDMAGPDLQGVAEKRDPAWLRRWLEAPDVMLAEGDPIATDLLRQYNNIPMPNQNLSTAEIDALLAYLGAADSGAVPPVQSAREVLTGNPGAGRSLFTGADRLSNGGAACIACHDSGTLGIPGGGLLGPDLTNAVARYGGESGMAAVLGNIPFPSMVPVYQDRPLTPQEQADLTAFMQQSAAKDTPSRGLRHFSLYILAFGLMDVFLLLLFVWHRRLPHHTRRPLSRR